MISLKDWTQPKLISIVTGESTRAAGGGCRVPEDIGAEGNEMCMYLDGEMCLDMDLS